MLSVVPVAEFAAESSSCPELTKLRQYIENSWPSTSKTLSADGLPYFPVRHELSIHDSYVQRGTHRLIVPLSLCSRLVKELLEPNNDFETYIGGLRWICIYSPQLQPVSPANLTMRQLEPHAPLTPVQYPVGPWQKLGIDVVGPFGIGRYDS